MAVQVAKRRAPVRALRRRRAQQAPELLLCPREERIHRRRGSPRILCDLFSGEPGLLREADVALLLRQHFEHLADENIALDALRRSLLRFHRPENVFVPYLSDGQARAARATTRYRHVAERHPREAIDLLDRPTTALAMCDASAGLLEHLGDDHLVVERRELAAESWSQADEDTRDTTVERCAVAVDEFERVEVCHSHVRCPPAQVLQFATEASSIDPSHRSPTVFA